MRRGDRDPGARCAASFSSTCSAGARQAADLLTEVSDCLSVTHMQEILRAAGPAAIHDVQSLRSQADLRAAVAVVRDANDTAQGGYPIKLEVALGLISRRAEN